TRFHVPVSQSRMISLEEPRAWRVPVSAHREELSGWAASVTRFRYLGARGRGRSRELCRLRRGERLTPNVVLPFLTEPARRSIHGGFPVCYLVVPGCISSVDNELRSEVAPVRLYVALCDGRC